MKKILLLLISGLLILCMAGSAMAIGLSFVGATYDEQGKAIVTLNSGTGQLNMKLSDLPTDDATYRLTLSTTSANLQAKILNLNNQEFLDFASTTPVYTDYGPLHTNTPYDFILYVVGTGQGDVTVTVSGPGISQSQSATVTATTIPEFPTVALPVAAILGLVFIFGRRKEGL